MASSDQSSSSRVSSSWPETAPLGRRTDDGADPILRAEPDPLQIADAHDREALLYDRLAAATAGLLYLGFLHAAEAHRAAARISRSSAGAG